MKKRKLAQARTGANQLAQSRLAARWPFASLRRIGVRGRVFIYFLVFTAALLALLWVFQIELLSHFYRLQKTQMLTATIDTLAANIENDDLQLLADRVSQANEICVLIVDDQAEKLISAESAHDCVIHRMTDHDLNRYIEMAQQDSKTLYRIFDLGNQPKSDYDQQHFSGPVPPNDDIDENRGQSMVAIRAVTLTNGEQRYIFVNAAITPVDATVQTLRSQYLFIAIFMVILSFLLSLVLSRRIAQPIIGANEAAKGLSLGRFEPAHTPVSYREIEQLNATLVQAAADLRRVEVMQRELIANISHDLRTPLTLIEGYAEAMRDLPGENTPENMQVIIEETRRLTSLVNAILEYSASQNGQSEVVPAVYSLTDSIVKILTRYRKLTEQDGYTIRFEQDRHVLVSADEMKIGQVLYNLINNALTYTGADKTVTVTQRVENGTVRVEVSDSGEGIDQSELPYIWSRYYRGKKPHKRAAVGTGLGLSIVKGILDAHRLEYGVTSRAGEGTTFWFTLAVVGTDAAEPPKLG